jgi:hypothetical protein
MLFFISPPDNMIYPGGEVKGTIGGLQFLASDDGLFPQR